MIITGVSGGSGGGDAYAYIKIFVQGATTVCAFIGDKCYGASKVNDGIAIIPVNKKGTYTVKAYVESQDGTYNQELVRTTTATITDSKTVVTAAIDGTYGDYGNLSFSSTTDAQFAAIVSALDAEKISINDLPWAVGDMRTVHLSSMPATGVGETHEEEDVTFVIQNVGGVTFTSGKQCHYVVGLLNTLNAGGYMNSSNTNSGSWKSSARRTWCNSVFRNAIPSTIRDCFKQFKCVTATEYSASTTTTTDDYFALPAAKEVFGGTATSAGSETGYSNLTEFNALTQFEWYKTSANRIKKLGNSSSASWWWERSPDYGYSNAFCGVNADGTAYDSTASTAYGLAPFGCI